MKRVSVLAAFLWGAGAAHAQPGVEATAPGDLGQYQNGGFSFSVGASAPFTETLSGTGVAEGGVAWATTVVLKGVTHGSDTTQPATPQHKLRVEVRPITDALTGAYTHEGTFTADMYPVTGSNFSDITAGGSGAGRTAYVTVAGLVPGVAYHWQAMSYKT